MKKLLLFIFILLGFIAKSQELDELYIRESLFIKDSSLNAVTYGDTALTIEQARLLFTGGGGGTPAGSNGEIQFNSSGSFGASSNLTFLGDSLTALNKIITDTLISNENIGIGTSNPLSALHINKGTGAENGINFNGTTEIWEVISGALTIETNGIRALTVGQTGFYGGAAATRGGIRVTAGSLTSATLTPYFTDSNTGIGGDGNDNTSIIAGGKEIARASENVTEQFIINPQGDLTGTLAAPSLAISETNTGFYVPSADNLVTVVNGIEAMRLTEDTVFVDSVFKAGEIISNGIIKVAKAEVLYTNTSSTTIVSIPNNGIVLEVFYEITDAFDDSGTDYLDIGNGPGSVHYLSDGDLSVERAIRADTYPWDQFSYPTGTNVDFIYQGQNGDATKGTANIYVYYVLY